jgi:hypothetical protein
VAFVALLNDKDLGVFVRLPRFELFFVPCYLGDVRRGVCSWGEFLTRMLGCSKSCCNGLGFGVESRRLSVDFFQLIVGCRSDPAERVVIVIITSKRFVSRR